MFKEKNMGYKAGSIALVSSLEKPVYGVIAEDLKEEVGYYINTAIGECTLLKEIDVHEDALAAYMQLVKAGALSISFQTLLDNIPLYGLRMQRRARSPDASDLNFNHWQKKIDTMRLANDLGLI